MERPEAPGFALLLAERLVSISDPVAVLLFGSWSKRLQNPMSDLDLAVVLDRPAAPVLRAELEDAVACVPLPVDLLVWTLEDVREGARDPHGFIGGVLRSSIPLHLRADAGEAVGQLLPTRRSLA